MVVFEWLDLVITHRYSRQPYLKGRFYITYTPRRTRWINTLVTSRNLLGLPQLSRFVDVCRLVEIHRDLVKILVENHSIFGPYFSRDLVEKLRGTFCSMSYSCIYSEAVSWLSNVIPEGIIIYYFGSNFCHVSQFTSHNVNFTWSQLSASQLVKWQLAQDS